MEGFTYYDVKKAPFSLHGFYDVYNTEGFVRVPADVAKATNPGVASHSRESAGGRIRFKTNSDSIVIKTKMLDRAYNFFNGAPSMESGFAVYVDTPFNCSFAGCTNPAPDRRFEYESEIKLGSGEKEITVCMPLYGVVEEVFIGLKDGSSLSEHTPYTYTTPVVYYGSSITQGAFSIRSGNDYENIISRRFDWDYINLGFAGACKGEDAIVDYIASIDMSAFVLDYDHNAPNVDHLRATHYKAYEKVRAAHPDIPIYMVTRPAYQYLFDTMPRRAVIMESYLKAFNSGDKNVFFIDGLSFSVGTELNDFSPDRCHPDNYGLRKMAEVIGDTLAKTVNFEKLK